MADRDPGRVSAKVDWREVARLVLTSRELDRLEEHELVPAKKVLYQFSARGHDLAQVLLGMQLKDGDGVFGYYRSRPLLLALGVPLADALGSGMGLAGGYSDGRDIGVVFNYPNPGGAHALPMCGGVGAQYTPAVGWAQAIAYKRQVLEEGPEDSIALVLGGDASCATGPWPRPSRAASPCPNRSPARSFMTVSCSRWGEAPASVSPARPMNPGLRASASTWSPPSAGYSSRS